MGNAAAREPAAPVPELNWFEAHYYSKQGLGVAVGSGAILGVAYTALLRTDQNVQRRHMGESGKDERFTLGSFLRSFLGGGLMFGALYVMAPPSLRWFMGFEPVVPGRELYLKQQSDLEHGR